MLNPSPGVKIFTDGKVIYIIQVTKDVMSITKFTQPSVQTGPPWGHTPIFPALREAREACPGKETCEARPKTFLLLHSPSSWLFFLLFQPLAAPTHLTPPYPLRLYSLLLCFQSAFSRK